MDILWRSVPTDVTPANSGLSWTHVSAGLLSFEILQMPILKHTYHIYELGGNR